MCIGPLFTVIPTRYHRYLSKDILKSYIACDDKYRDQLQKQMCLADIPVIIREYTIAVYPKVLDNLNAIGKAALEDLHPWILCTLIDWERFDRVICDMPGSTCEAGAEGSVVQLPQESSTGKNSVDPPSVDKETKQTSSAQDSNNGERHEWNEAETKLLLDTTAENMEKLKTAKNKNKVWSCIAGVLIRHGFNVTVTQCIDRYKYMKRSYKAYLDKSKKSGSGKCSFKYDESVTASSSSTPVSEPKRYCRRSMINELKELMEERDQRLLSALKKMNNEQNELMKKLIDKL
ncbi:hypothetical protein DPMN_082077 [Dreissena polymorpha]|uniref:Myb/SANT-like DNA-binding domain-containing protein n=2 Tax=Dreissena polymorpha TaxID=45954 RepID=A0A9D3YA24_DREPO|nr:hypothetical protein DPMN_082077 [Dreissena polymorpha]